MLLKSYLVVPIFFFFLNLFAVFPRFYLSADIRQVEIEGTYSVYEKRLRGNARYQTDCYADKTLEFHLPPNRNDKTDWRSRFQIQNIEGGLNTYDRSDLGELKKYRRSNPQLPYSIKILETRISGKQVEFDIIDNPLLSPLKNTLNSILVLKNPAQTPSCEADLTVDIDFVTNFGDISEDWVNILWDFIPRIVKRTNGQPDYSDHWSEIRQYNYQIQLIGKETQQEPTFLEGYSQSVGPVIIADAELISDNDINLTLDGYLEEDREFYRSGIKKVKRFLIQNRWLLEEDLKQHFVMWSGPLTVTGSHIFLPQRLFRYPSIYHKTFEAVLLRAFIHSSLLQRFSLNTTRYPWIEPAISGEIIRDYFVKEYSGDTKYFPWGQWLNPDFYQENTIKTWLNYPGNKKMISSAESKDLRFLSNVYHPWHEKGFHLFRSIVTNGKELGSDIHPALKRLLKMQVNEVSILDKKTFYASFGFTNEQETKADKWLSVEGRVDYEIQDVDIIKKDQHTDVILTIANHGSLSPPFEIVFLLRNGLTVTKQIDSGKGTYDFSFPSPPIEISLDPKHTLLESKLLNNYWYTPLKVRPIWDFPSTNSWIVTISPVINGNTFDKNLFGLSLGVRYLNKTEFYISGWRSDGDERILWESNLFHFGFPWQGSELSLESSELNASMSKTVGYRHNYPHIHENLWFSLDLLEETLDRLEEDVSSDNNTWQSVETKLSFPIYVGDFSDSVIEVSRDYGKNTEEDGSDFSRIGVSNQSVWFLNNWKIHLELSSNDSTGFLPLQKKFPIGGPEALPGFPREEDLLFDQRSIAGFGITLPPYLTHTNINALRLGWLEKVETALFFHWAEAKSGEIEKSESFKDIELRFNFTVSWLNMYEGDGVVAIAQPLDNEEYKDYRIILFSNWVF